MDLMARKIFLMSWIGGITFLAGATNISGIILFGEAVSHYTGNISNAAIALANEDFKLFGSLLSIVILFFLGSTVSGLLFYRKNSNNMKRLYTFLPIIYGVIILLMFFLNKNRMIIFCFFAFYMGVQNAFHLKVRGSTLRITHITGYLTDAGLVLSVVLKGGLKESWKVLFYIFSITCFFLGGLVSTIIIKWMGDYTIVALALSYIGMGIYTGVGLVSNLNRRDELLV